MMSNGISTVQDEMRAGLSRIQQIVATAEVEARDLTPDEDIEVKTLNQRLRSLDTKRTLAARGDTFNDLVRDVRVAGDQRGRPGDTLGAQLVKSESFANLRTHLGHGRPVSMSPVELRAATPTLPPGGGYTPTTGAPPATQPLAPWGAGAVASLFPSLPAQGGSIAYLRDVRTGLETPITSTAAGALKPETVLAPLLVEAALVTLATWSKVSNVVPEDVEGFRAWMDSVLLAGVADAEAAYIVATILATAGILTVTPAAGAAVADTLLDAAMQVQARSDLPATGAIVAPNTFTALATSKAAGGGTYLSGAPFSASPSLTLWGQLQIVVSSALAAGTALVVAGRAGATYRKNGLRVDISDSNEDDFLKNLLTVRVEERVAFATYKPTGFATVTGLVTP